MATTVEDVTKLDLYELFGIKTDATPKEIKTAYRKKALTCHPDKNPDNPDAAKLFHQLSRALEILTDIAAKEAYDKILKARKASQIRNQQLDSKRKKLKEELENREKDAELERQQSRSVDEELKLRKEIERLRKQGSKQVEEEMEYLRQQIKIEKERQSKEGHSDSPRFKIQWKKPEDGSVDPYTEQTLMEMFQKYGDVTGLVKSKKRRAVIEFSNIDAAESAFRCELGFSNAPLQFTWISKPPSNAVLQQTSNVHNSPTANHDQATLADDYENLVLRKLRQAEERKRIIQQMETDDVSETG